MEKHTKHNPNELVDALEHVVYEIWKYKQSVAHYAPIQISGGDAALEFRVLHHRVLLEFFHGPAKHRNNIVAWEYVEGWQKRHKPSTPPWVRAYMTRCHTMLAHISTKRSEISKAGLKDWGYEWRTVEPHLDQTIVEFLNGLSTDHRSICRQWIERWSAGHGNGNEVLADLIRMVDNEK